MPPVFLSHVGEGYGYETDKEDDCTADADEIPPAVKGFGFIPDGRVFQSHEIDQRRPE